MLFQHNIHPLVSCVFVSASSAIYNDQKQITDIACLVCSESFKIGIARPDPWWPGRANVHFEIRCCDDATQDSGYVVYFARPENRLDIFFHQKYCLSLCYLEIDVIMLRIKFKLSL